MSKADLPSFKNPPVVETVLGLQFDPIKGFSNAHLGAFWKTLAKAGVADQAWTNVADATPLAPSFERFGADQPWLDAALRVRLSQDPPATRLQIRNQSGDAMVQLQNGRLHLNWVRGNGGEYPRYAALRPRFDSVRAQLEAFLADEGLPLLKPNQWEVTYVNHIPRGSVWESPADWAEGVFPGLLSGQPAPADVRMESIEGTWHFEIPERRGRLHVNLRVGKTQDEQPIELVRMTLTARGPLGSGVSGPSSSAAEGLDLGHRVIVRTFADLTAEAAHRIWKRES